MRHAPSLIDVVRTELAGLVASFYALALFLIAIVVAIPIFVVTGLGLVGLTTAIGATGTPAAVLSIGWFVIFIGGTAVAVTRIVLWLRPVTAKVESLADLEHDETVQAATVPDTTSPYRPPTPPPAGSTGDPLIAEEVRRWRESQRR